MILGTYIYLYPVGTKTVLPEKDPNSPGGTVMSGYKGMVLVGGILVAIALLRGLYGRPSGRNAWYEELATYGALLLFVVAVSLTVARSPEGIERFRQDISQTLPYSMKQVPLSREAVVLQLSTIPVDNKTPRANCSTCHAPRKELIPQLAARVIADGNTMEKEFETLLKPLKRTMNSNREAVRHLPKAESGQGVWAKLAGWLTPEGRHQRKMQQQVQDKQGESLMIETRIRQINSYYKSETFQKQKTEYAGMISNAVIPSSVQYLLLAADNNTTFYNALCKGNEDRIKAGWSLRMLEWGAPLFVVAVLSGRLLLRRRYPETEWYIFPGMVLFAGISLQLMTDLSLNYLPKLRFIALYHWRNTLAAMLFLFVAAPLSGVPLTRGVLARFLEQTRRTSLKTTLTFCIVVLAVAVAGYFMPTDRYKMAEILKLLLIGFLAWYAIIRGEYISRKTAMTGLKGNWWIINNLLEFLMISLVVIVAFLTIHDLGPLLVTLLFLCAFIWLLMGTGRLLGVLSFWGGLAVLALSLRGWLTQLGWAAYLFRRIDEMVEPFKQGSGEIAKLQWLRGSAGFSGHSFGELPYYGHYIKQFGSTTVVTPAQIQSDYTATHIVAVWGYLPGLLLLAIYLAWIMAVFTIGARNAASAGKSQSARFVGWFIALAALMVFIQALLTLAGNYAIAPLSGLTMPMVSYGSATMIFCTLLITLIYAQEKMS